MKEKTKYISPNEALEKAKSVGVEITYATLLYWIEKNKLGIQPGGPGSKWFVNIEKFNAILEGKHNRRIQDGKNEIG